MFRNKDGYINNVHVKHNRRSDEFNRDVIYGYDKLDVRLRGIENELTFDGYIKVAINAIRLVNPALIHLALRLSDIYRHGFPVDTH